MVRIKCSSYRCIAVMCREASNNSLLLLLLLLLLSLLLLLLESTLLLCSLLTFLVARSAANTESSGKCVSPTQYLAMNSPTQTITQS